MAAPPCGNDGNCNGMGGCEQAPMSVTCGMAGCMNGMLTGVGNCNGMGSCQQTPVDCAPYTCNSNGTACRTTCSNISQCATGNYCDGNSNHCMPQGGPGVQCTMNEQCLSGHCNANPDGGAGMYCM
jgi:hypothetical protein